MSWTDQKKAQVIQKYTDIMANEHDTDESRAAATVEVVKELAVEFEETTNGVRAILNKDGCYIKKGTAKPTTVEGTEKAPRVNKAEAHQALKDQIEMIDPSLISDEIISKLTGKAALYFSSIFQQVTK